MEDLPLFRAPKRRKIAQVHHVDRDDVPTARKEHEEVDEAMSQSGEEGVANVVRGQKRHRSARSGVTFSTSSGRMSEQLGSTALARADTSQEKPRDMSNRFVGSTGAQAVNVNDHMMAYIDSEMAKGRQLNLVTNHQNTAPAGSPSEQHPQSTTHDNTTPQPQAHQLSEVDLSSLPTPSNQSTTKSGPRQPPRKPRLGRDGKPLRRLRPPKRRNSEDLARDALVEQVLHEHRLENVYQPPKPETGPGTVSAVEPQPGDATSRDEDFAERFRQDFLDQIAERKQALQQKKTAAAGAAVEKTQGPKLGGSRAARARMAAATQQQQQQQQGAGSGGQK